MTVLDDYKRWHHLQVETGDIDPVYPVYRWLGERWKLGKDQLAWLCICHVIYYHSGSALTLFRQLPSPKHMPATADALGEEGWLTLPTATERRAHRDVRQLAKHILDVREQLGDEPYAWLGANGWDWEPLNKRIMELHGNGRWAAYKLAEMLQKVAGAPTEATDAGHRYSTGPRKGLQDLYGDLVPEGQGAADIAVLDAITAGLQNQVGEKDVALIETSLCDFHSLTKGSYYLGHDIDGMQEQLNHPKVNPGTKVWEGRAAVFDHELLGEQNGWSGVRRDLKTRYRRTGQLDWREDFLL